MKTTKHRYTSGVTLTRADLVQICDGLASVYADDVKAKVDKVLAALDLFDGGVTEIVYIDVVKG